MPLVKVKSAGTENVGGGSKNVLINGGMQIFQRSTSTTGIGGSSGYFTADRIRFKLNSTAGRLTSTQDSSAPSGFGNSLKLDCTTADTSIGAGEQLLLQQKIEGQDLQQFAKGTSDAKPFTVSFYVKGNASATYTCELYDVDNTRHISKTFSVTTDWTRVELLFPADTTGAFDDDNASSMVFGIWLHAGTNYTSGTLNSSSWASATTANRVSSSNTSFFDSTDRTFFLTGLQLETTASVTPFEHSRSFGEELALCERYFVECFSGDSNYESAGSGWAYSGGVVVYKPLRVQMRARPTISKSASGTIHVSDDVNTSINVSNIITSTNVASRDIMYMECTASGVTTYRSYNARANGTTTDASIKIDAEL